MKKVTNTLCRIVFSLTAAILMFSFLKTNTHAANDTIVIDFSQGQQYSMTYEEYQNYFNYSSSSCGCSIKKPDVSQASASVKNSIFTVYFMEDIANTYEGFRSNPVLLSLLNEDPQQTLCASVNEDYMSSSSSIKPTDTYVSVYSKNSVGTYEATLSYKAEASKKTSKRNIDDILKQASRIYGIDAKDANGDPYIKVKFIFSNPNSAFVTLNADGTVTIFIPDKEFTENDCSYKVTADNEVCFTGVTNKKAKSVNIPDSVVHQNIVYNVTSVADKALYKNKKVKSITVGQNVKTIGRSAFAACSKLSSVKINCSSLKALGKKAMSGASKDLVVKVPKAQYKRFKKAFKKAGMSTVKIKKSK